MSGIKRWVGCAAAILVVTSAGGFALGTHVSTSSFTGCYRKRTGEVTLIKEAGLPGRCPRGRVKFVFDQQGPQGLPGPAGPQGPEGPQGPQGVPGVEVTESMGTVYGPVPKVVSATWAEPTQKVTALYAYLSIVPATAGCQSRINIGGVSLNIDKLRVDERDLTPASNSTLVLTLRPRSRTFPIADAQGPIAFYDEPGTHTVEVHLTSNGWPSECDGSAITFHLAAVSAAI